VNLSLVNAYRALGLNVCDGLKMKQWPPPASVSTAKPPTTRYAVGIFSFWHVAAVPVSMRSGPLLRTNLSHRLHRQMVSE
jgi:hypothetical protein